MEYSWIRSKDIETVQSLMLELMLNRGYTIKNRPSVLLMRVEGDLGELRSVIEQVGGILLDGKPDEWVD